MNKIPSYELAFWARNEHMPEFLRPVPILRLAFPLPFEMEKAQAQMVKIKKNWMEQLIWVGWTEKDSQNRGEGLNA